MSFVDNALYRGQITKQEMVESRDGHPQLNLFVKLEGRLADNRRPEAGLLDCPKVEICVSLRFPTDDPDKVGYAAQDLERLGFADDDLGRLAPGHKKHVSFVGKAVHASPRTKEYNGSLSTFWNLRHPRTFEDKPIDAAKLTKSKAGDAFREAVRRRKEEAEARAAGQVETPF